MYRFINYKKVNKIYLIILIFFALLGTANSIERTKKEIKIGIFLEDFEKFGKFEKINNTPKGMFTESVDTFHEKQIISKKSLLKLLLPKKDKWKKILTKLFSVWHILNFFICNS